MFIAYLLEALAASVVLASAVHAIPTTSDNPLWTWAKDPVNCENDACISDCQAAAAKVCALDLKTYQSIIVGDCSVLYWYDDGNTLPTAAQCNAVYHKITGPASKAGSATDCPGNVGGVSGYDTNGKRTNNPIYVVSPKTGNGNCLKAPSDTSPVLAAEALPNGQTLTTCPVSSSRRTRAIESLEARGQGKCFLEDAFVNSGCSATCILSVTAAGWETGPFVTAGWVSCLGICGASAYKTFTTCMKENAGSSAPPKKRDAEMSATLKGRDTDRVDTCMQAPLYAWPCPQMEKSILSAGFCNVDALMVGTSGTGTVNY